MTNQSIPDKANLKGEDPAGSAAEELSKNTDKTGAQAPQDKSAYDQRKVALSKREIMEELSRQRFPWDD